MTATPTHRSVWLKIQPASRSNARGAATAVRRGGTECRNRLISRALQQACDRAAANGLIPVQFLQEDPSTVEQDMTETDVVEETVDELAVLRAVAADAATFFRACLVEPTAGRRTRRALAARRLPILTAADGIGYAPEGWTALTTHLQGLGYTDEHLLAAGVSVRSRTTHLIDRFRARITFAVHDAAGDVVGFTARAFDEDRAAAAAAGHDLPKYLNTCETALYRKREVLYGLTPQVRRLLGAGALPVLVEGPTDALAITLAGAGSYVGIASCGTALTSEHLDLLHDVLQVNTTGQGHDTSLGTSGLGRRGLAVAFDCDKAGRGAARRAFELATARGLRLLEVTLPEGGDPASLPRTQLAELLEHVQHTPLVLSLIRDAVTPWTGRLHEDTSQLNAVRAAVRLIDPVHDDLDMGQCLAAVAVATGADAGCVVDELLDHRTNSATA
ncbi:toprim domain-containing protein [Kineococcus rubinsiae]|uniref:toprim domain-containing protein n=1 Tax=Kineococcus rubinsiae TaxID=2609562 RepID=UPI0014317933|nr:toprim domain-containing protein [Kineococcus rubinsiae]NIZ91760.1 hypothetical protein [Kineococcus rubinsiae]